MPFASTYDMNCMLTMPIYDLMWCKVGGKTQKLTFTPRDNLTDIPYLTDGPVGWGCRIHRLHLDRGVRPFPLQKKNNKKSILKMILKNLMVRLQLCWIFREC